MSEQERQLVDKMAKCVLAKSMNSNNNLVDYRIIGEEIHVPVSIVRTVASQVCKWLLKSPRVDDADCFDNYAFDVMLKRRIVRG